MTAHFLLATLLLNKFAHSCWSSGQDHDAKTEQEIKYRDFHKNKYVPYLLKLTWLNGPEAEEMWPGALCKKGAGTRQSPIDIPTPKATRDFEKEFIKYGPLKFRGYDDQNNLFDAFNNGHTLQLICRGTNGIQPTVQGGPLHQEYRLEQIHFHQPSEHAINGEKFPMEVHFVHIRSDLDADDALNEWNGLAILAVFWNIQIKRPARPVMRREDILHFAKLVVPGAKLNNILMDAGNLLSPNRRSYFTYAGSLSSPECNEAVIWIIFEEPMMVAEEHYRIFGYIGMQRNNFRSLQPLVDHQLYRTPYRAIMTPLLQDTFSAFTDIIKGEIKNFSRAALYESGNVAKAAHYTVYKFDPLKKKNVTSIKVTVPNNTTMDEPDKDFQETDKLFKGNDTGDFLDKFSNGKDMDYTRRKKPDDRPGNETIYTQVYTGDFRKKDSNNSQRKDTDGSQRKDNVTKGEDTHDSKVTDTDGSKDKDTNDTKAEDTDDIECEGPHNSKVTNNNDAKERNIDDTKEGAADTKAKDTDKTKGQETDDSNDEDSDDAKGEDTDGTEGKDDDDTKVEDTDATKGKVDEDTKVDDTDETKGEGRHDTKGKDTEDNKVTDAGDTKREDKDGSKGENTDETKEEDTNDSKGKDTDNTKGEDSDVTKGEDANDIKGKDADDTKEEDTDETKGPDANDTKEEDADETKGKDIDDTKGEDAKRTQGKNTDSFQGKDKDDSNGKDIDDSKGKATGDLKGKDTSDAQESESDDSQGKAKGESQGKETDDVKEKDTNYSKKIYTEEAKDKAKINTENKDNSKAKYSIKVDKEITKLHEENNNKEQERHINRDNHKEFSSDHFIDHYDVEENEAFNPDHEDSFNTYHDTHETHHGTHHDTHHVLDVSDDNKQNKYISKQITNAKKGNKKHQVKATGVNAIIDNFLRTYQHRLSDRSTTVVPANLVSRRKGYKSFFDSFREER